GGPTAGGGRSGGGPATAAGAIAARGVPHAWQKALPSGFWIPQRGQASAIYFTEVLAVFAAASALGRRFRLTAVGAALSAMPQLGQKPEATIYMWQLGHTVSARPMCAASSSSA